MIMRKPLFACAMGVVLAAVVGCEEIIGPIGDPVDLSYAPCLGAPDAPIWFAFQDGDGSWQRVNATASGSFDFAIASGKGGIAIVNPNDELTVIYATTEELQALVPACDGSVRSVNSSVTGYATADNVQLFMGSSEDVVFGSEPPPAFFSLVDVAANASDLVGVRHRSSSGSGVTFEVIPNSIFLRRNVTGSSTSLVDFSSATEAGAPLRREINVTNVVSGEGVSAYSVIALGSTVAPISEYEASTSLVSGSVIVAFYGVPATRLNAGETHSTTVVARKASGSTVERRISAFVFTNPVDQSLTLGPALGPVTVTGTSRPSATYSVQAFYDKVFEAVFEQGSGSTARRIRILSTTGYLDGATSVTLTVPNLVGVSGFSSNWLLVPGVSSYWAFQANNADLAAWLTNRPITFQAADRSAPFTP
jgi:hypothetical protein